MSKAINAAILSVALVTWVPGLAMAENTLGFHGWGPRVGFTSGPGQFHIGAGLDLGDFVPNLRFQPNVEVGFGHSETIATFNAETAYYFPQRRASSFSPFLGGGVGLNSYSSGSFHGDSTDMGLNILGGLEFPVSGSDTFDTEAKIGLTNSPDFKLTFSYMFR
jgi:hypothetical protein